MKMNLHYASTPLYTQEDCHELEENKKNHYKYYDNAKLESKTKNELFFSSFCLSMCQNSDSVE